MSVKWRGHDYNIVVIGGGAAGLVAANLGASLRAKVALIEMKKMGGDCLNTGCIPSKTLIKTAKIASLRHRAEEFGIGSIEMELSFPKVMKRIRAAIEKIAPNDSVERYNAMGVACFESAGRILSPREVIAGGKLLRTKSIIIASGARPAVPEIPGLADMNPLTSESLWNLESLPRRLLVLGGGVIGCELAQAFQRLGSQVTLVERNDRILPREDKDVSEVIQGVFEREGVRLVLNAKNISFRKDGSSKLLVSGEGPEVEFDHVLVALGRRPNVEGLGLEEVGVQLRENGTIFTDLAMRTSVKGIFACGDVAGPLQFTHFASHSAAVAATNALIRPFRTKIDLRVFPWAVFTDPEIARVGWSESEASVSGANYEVYRFDFSHSDRAVTEGETQGFVKVVVGKKTGKILGATIVGPSAGELIQEYAIAMKYGLRLNHILAAVHAYPTLMEANRSVATAWRRATAPASGLNFLQALNRIRRAIPW